MTFRVVVAKNPLTFASERQIFESRGPVPLLRLIESHCPAGDADTFVRVNGRAVSDRVGVVVNDGDFVELIARAGASSIILAYGLSGVAAAVVTVAVNIVVSLAFQAVVKALGNGDDDALGKNNGPLAVYNIASGSNAVRRFGAIPVLLGRMRIYPDVCALPYTEFVRDVNAVSPADGVVSSILYTPTFASSWTPYGVGGDLFLEPDPFPSNASSLNVNAQNVGAWADYDAVTLPHGWVYRSSTGEYSRLATVQNDGVFVPETPPQYQLEFALSIEGFDQTQRLTQILNAGYGDLVLTEPRIRDSLIDDRANGVDGTYRGTVFRRAVLTDTESRLDGYPSNTNYTLTDSQRWPEVVISESGAGLIQSPGVELGGWVERQSPPDAIQCQLDIVGRLYLVGAGVGQNEAILHYEYRPANSGGAWTAGAPVTIRNSDTNLVRKTVTINFSAPGEYAVRARQITATPNDGNNIIELEVAEFKFQRDFKSTDFETRGQNRIGLAVTATAQLNGTVQKLNVIASAKTWRYTGPAVWDGTTPQSGLSWSWGETEYVADWFLYMVLGGYTNSGVTTGPFAGKGWHLGPHDENAERLFGAGLQHSQIDYASIVAFRAYCVRENLTIGAYLNDATAIGELLNKIAAVGRGSWSWQTGKLGVVYEDKLDDVSALFSAANILAGSFSISYQTGTLSDAYEASYTDSDDDRFELATVTANRPGVVEPRTTGKLDLFGVNNTSQAQRAVNITAARTLYQRRQVSFNVAGHGFSTVRGDVVALGHDLTQWAVESRFYALEIEAGFVREIDLVRAAQWDGTGPLWVQVQLPDGRMIGGQVETFNGERETVRLIGDWFAAADAPGWLDQAETENTGAAMAFADLSPESFFCLMGPVETPGKRLRIVSVRPAVGGTFSMTAIDDDPALWAHETAVGAADVPASGEHVPVRAFDPMITPDDAGRLWLSFGLDGVSSAAVSLSVSGGPWASYGPIAGQSVQLPDYAPGTAFAVTVYPVVDALDPLDPHPYCIDHCTMRYVVPEPVAECA